MKLRIVALVAVLGLSAVWLLTPNHPSVGPVIPPLQAATAPQSPPSPCTFPTAMNGMSDAEIAWRLFVAAACPVANDPNAMVTWEKWEEQSQVFPPSAQQGAAPPSRFHPSVLEQMLHPGNKLEQLNLGTAGCAPGVNPAYPGGPKRTICEEVRLNPDSVTYITSNGLTTHTRQGAFVKNHGAFDFPVSAIELKADWVQQNSMDLCNHPPTTVHVEKATDPKTKVTHCYALAGIHINSKLTPNWIWATWEPQNNAVNPMRCFVLGCSDSWGANPSTLPANQKTPPTSAQTAALTALMKQAGLAPEWFNYRLDGVQTQYVDAQGKPTLLGNSVTEAESVGLALTQASCITCHGVSSVNASGTDGGTLLKGPPVVRPIGNPGNWPPVKPPAPGFVSRDFSWVFVVAQ